MSGLVFISYRRHASAALAQLADAQLRTRGYKTFLDVSTEEAGRFTEQIELEIAGCHAFVLICTPGSFDRKPGQDDWVARECELALEHKKRIIPFFSPEFEPPAVLPPSVQLAFEFTAVRLSTDFPDATFKRLVKLIGPPRQRGRLAFAAAGMVLALTTAAFIHFIPPEVQQSCLSSSAGRSHNRDEKTGIELVRIPSGEFTMGSPDGDGYPDEHPSHRVRVSSFELAKYSVTNEQYAKYLAANPSARKPGEWNEARKNPHLPVVRVSWLDAWAFAQWAGMRLPTEAEREYATRAGTSTRFFSGDAEADAERVAWFDSNSGDHLHEVCTKKPNAFGLHDMHGNVWEWCSDWFERYPARTSTTLVDPQGPESGTTRVIRGGYYNRPPDEGRSAARDNREPETREYFIGFRVARDVGPAPSPSASTVSPFATSSPSR